MKGGDGAMVQWCNTTRGAESLQSLFPFINNLRAFQPLERASSLCYDIYITRSARASLVRDRVSRRSR